MKHLFATAALALTFPAAAQEPVTPSSVVANASADEWQAIAPDDLLVMELAQDARGNARTVVIQLMPPPFSQPWVENVRRLAEAHWWDGTSVYRVQDNYVTQWGDVTEEKPLPKGVASPEAGYTLQNAGIVRTGTEATWTYQQEPNNPRLINGQIMLNSPSPGRYDTFWQGWPVGGMIRPHDSLSWPIHCYGHIGVARDYAPDTGTGAELFTIIGTPQRHMDGNLAVVGRVIEGMEHLASLPRGSGELGFYAEDEADLRTSIVSVRLASELPDPPAFEYLDTTSESFARYVAVRANRNDPFYTVPAGGVDVCSVQVPVRRVAD
jgi:peptidylprolyl isomerase